MHRSKMCMVRCWAICHGKLQAKAPMDPRNCGPCGCCPLWEVSTFLDLSCLGAAADAVVSKWKARQLREHCISEAGKWNDFSPLSRVQVNGDFQGVVRGVSGGGACMERAKCGK